MLSSPASAAKIEWELLLYDGDKSSGKTLYTITDPNEEKMVTYRGAACVVEKEKTVPNSTEKTRYRFVRCLAPDKKHAISTSALCDIGASGKSMSSDVNFEFPPSENILITFRCKKM